MYERILYFVQSPWLPWLLFILIAEYNMAMMMYKMDGEQPLNSDRVRMVLASLTLGIIPLCIGILLVGVTLENLSEWFKKWLHKKEVFGGKDQERRIY